MRIQTHILFTGIIIAIIMIPKLYNIPIKSMSVHVLLNYMFSVLELIIITKRIIITITLPITHLIQIIILNKLSLEYMYPSIYIRGHYYIFNNYLYLKKKMVYGISSYIIIHPISSVFNIIEYLLYIILHNQFHNNPCTSSMCILLRILTCI